MWTLGAVQPLLALSGDNVSFLLHHRLDGVDLGLWCGLLVLGPPLVVWSLELGVERLAGTTAADRLHAVVLGALVAILLLGALRKLGDPLPTWALLPAVGLLAWLTAELSRRRLGVRRFWAFLVLALPVPLALFWSSAVPGTARAAAGERPGEPAAETEVDALPGEEARRSDLPPIVLVVFDELPFLSLVDGELGIDRDLCPNLARFAATATWYRNASTVWSLTSPSIASLLTGRVVEASTPPTRRSLPRNLLTWLDATHDVRAVEITTSLAPASPAQLTPPRPRGARLAGLVVDSAIVFAHLITPPDLGGVLPPIGDRWGGFGERRVVRGRGAGAVPPAAAAPWAFALADGRGPDFTSFLAGIGDESEGARRFPGVHFVHVMLPHMPYRYLPSGRVYGGRSVTRDGARAWSEGGWFALETYQRHMLQVGFVDRLVGRLIDRLRTIGLWDETLVVLTADHGVSHWPGEDRRKPTETRHPEDIWRVPLLIKAPHQTTGRIDDRPALSIDVVPTVAALLGVAVDWPVDGVPLTGKPTAVAERTVLVDGGRAERRIDGDPRPDIDSLARKLELFDAAAGELRWVRLGPYRAWIGRTPEGSPRPRAGGLSCRAEIDQRPVVERYDPISRYSPALLTGELECDGELPRGAFLLAAVNGRFSGSDRLEPVDGGRALFAVMTAEASWREGSNRVELYVATGGAGSTRLTRVEDR